jgi:hypothetical protein
MEERIVYTFMGAQDRQSTLYSGVGTRGVGDEQICHFGLGGSWSSGEKESFDLWIRGRCAQA